MTLVAGVFAAPLVKNVTGLGPLTCDQWYVRLANSAGVPPPIVAFAVNVTLAVMTGEAEGVMERIVGVLAATPVPALAVVARARMAKSWLLPPRRRICRDCQPELTTVNRRRNSCQPRARWRGP